MTTAPTPATAPTAPTPTTAAAATAHPAPALTAANAAPTNGGTQPQQYPKDPNFTWFTDPKDGMAINTVIMLSMHNKRIRTVTALLISLRNPFGRLCQTFAA